MSLNSFKVPSNRANGQVSNNTPIPMIPSSMIVNQNSSILMNPIEDRSDVSDQYLKRKYKIRSYPNLYQDTNQENRMVVALEFENRSEEINNHKTSTRGAESLTNLSSRTKPRDYNYKTGRFNDSFEDEEARVLLIKQSKCRYKVMFKTKSNADTKLILNTVNRKKCNSE